MSDATSPSTPARSPRQEERRRLRRVALAWPVRIRPSDPSEESFEEVATTVNVSREGLYFYTRSTSYTKGLRLFLTYPYMSSDSVGGSEYLAEVVRVDTCQDGRRGVAVRLIMTLNLTPFAMSAQTVQMRLSKDSPPAAQTAAGSEGGRR